MIIILLDYIIYYLIRLLGLFFYLILFTSPLQVTHLLIYYSPRV